MAGDRYLRANDLAAGTNHAPITRLAGWSVRETAGTPAQAKLRLRHGSSTGQILATVRLAQETSETVELNREIRTPSGVYLEIVTGTVEAVAYTSE